VAVAVAVVRMGQVEPMEREAQEVEVLAHHMARAMQLLEQQIQVAVAVALAVEVA